MIRKMTTILFILAGGFLAALIAGSMAGCGEEKQSPADTQPPPTLPPLAQTGGEDLNKKIEDLKMRPLTVEIMLDGKSSGKWTQNGKGSWRYDSGPDSYIIYNAARQKGWVVSGKTATETMDIASLPYSTAGSPITLLTAYSGFAAVPRTGGTDDTWEWNIAGLGTLKIEFKGPSGLISKLVSDTPAGGMANLDFIYTNLDNVPESAFELPPDVQVTAPPQTGGAGGMATIPGTDGFEAP